MSEIFKSKIDELLEELRKNNRLTELPATQVLKIDRHISKDMSEFRQELLRKHAQSNADIAKIILSA